MNKAHTLNAESDPHCQVPVRLCTGELIPFPPGTNKSIFRLRHLPAGIWWSFIFTAMAFVPGISQCELTFVCPPSNNSIFGCADDVPLPDPSVIIVSDSCNNVTITVSDEATGAGCGLDTMIVTRTYTISDGVTTGSCQQFFYVLDILAPILECPGDELVSCPSDVPPPTTDGVIVDENCPGDVTLVVNPDIIIDSICPNHYTIIRNTVATDACGNSITHHHAIVVWDQIPPSIQCPADFSLSCEEPVPEPDISGVIASDNCGGGVTVTVAPDIVNGGPCANSYSIIRVFTATDACGNSATCSQTITITDGTPPTVELPSAVVVACAADLPPADVSSIVTSDGCGEVIVTFVEDIISNVECANSYLVTRVFSVSDLCGNSSTFTQLIQVEDLVAPSITCPPNVTVSCNSLVPDPNPADVFMADNCLCGITASFEEEITTSLGCPNNFLITRIYSVVDSCGNEATCPQTIMVEDNTVPMIMCPPNMEVLCPDEVPPPDVALPAVMDNCDGLMNVTVAPDVTVNQICPGTFTVSRIYTADDLCGNTSVCLQQINVRDAVAPTITCPANITIACPTDVPAPDLDAVITGDGCGGIITVSVAADVTINLVCPGQYQINRVYTATDACGNSATCEQLITVHDLVSPTIICPVDITLAGCNSAIPAPDPGLVNANDGCGIVTVSFLSDVSDTTGCIETTVRTYQAVDACGNVATCSQTFTRTIDNTPPSISCPSNVTLAGCNGVVPAADITDVTVSDGCGNATVTFVNDVVDTTGCTETTVRTYQAVDACGNVATCSQTFTRTIDITPPSISCPSNVTLAGCNGVVPAADITDVTVSDGCGNATVTFVNDVVDTAGCTETTVRTYQAVDACGNVATCSQTFTRTIDNTPPSISCPSNVTIAGCNGVVPAADITDVTVSDGCGNATVTFVNDVVDTTGCTETTVRTYQAVDACGNVATCSHSITRTIDTTPPTISCPANVTLSGCNPVVPAPNTSQVAVIDGCGSATVTFTNDAVSPVGCTEVITRTYTATDACGNTAQCTQTFTRTVDFTPPTISCPDEVTVACSNDIPVANIGLVTALDDCGAVTISVAPDEIFNFACDNRYDVRRIYTAIDACGNSSTCEQIIHVNDTIGPLMSCVGEMNFSCAAQLPGPDIASIIVSDNCGGNVTVTVEPDIISDETCPNHFTLTRIYVGTDACGNTTEYVQVFMVSDETAPAIECPSNITVECSEDVPVADVHDASATDNCGGNVLITVAPDKITSQLCPNSYVITRVFTATDSCGNFATCAQTITVTDTVAPQITCPDDITVFCNDIPSPAIDSIEAFDNCGAPVAVVHVSDVSIGEPCNFSIERTYSATDACGNSATCIQRIFVLDTVALPEPILIVAPADITIQCYGQDSSWTVPVYDVHSITASGGCMDNLIVDFDQSIAASDSCAEDGFIAIYTMTWNVSDTCGNSATAISHMTIIDTIAPVIHNVPADITVAFDSIPTAITLHATDECLCACVMLIEETPLDSTLCPDGQVIIRTWKSTDACGNMATASQRITISGGSGGTMTLNLPEELHISHGDELNFRCSEGGIPEAIKNLDANSIIMNAPGGAATVEFTLDTLHFPNCEPFGYIDQHVFTWQAQDVCDNTAEFSFTVTVVDDEAPEFIDLPAFACMGDTSLNTVEVIEACSQATVTFTEEEISNPCGTGTAILRTYEAIDECGNVATGTVTFVPDNNINPMMVFNHPDLIGFDSGDTITTECHAASGLYTDFDSSYVDVVALCPQGVKVDFEETVLFAGDCVTDGSVAIVRLDWTATDYCGNSSTLQLFATVVDETPPVIVNFQNVTVSCTEDLPEPQATDNCDIVTVNHFDIIVPGPCEFEYDIQRMITALDQCGNTAVANQLIHVGSGDGPAIEGIDAIVCDDLSMPPVSAFDECAGESVPVSMTQDTLSGTCHEGLVIRRTWTAENSCGQIAEIEQLIIIGDTVAPEIQIPANSILNFYTSQDTIPLVLMSDAQSMNALNALNANSIIVVDDCDTHIIPGFSITVTASDSVPLDGFTEQRYYLWIVEDICGNADTLDFTVNILDDMPPVVGLPMDLTVACAPLPEPDIMTPIDSNDIVDIDFVETMVPGNRPGEFLVTRTWTITDLSGNTTVVIQRITWIPDTFVECEIILPEKVPCNTHGLVIGSFVTGGVGPFTYLWDVEGDDCFIQTGQNTPQIEIYMGWADVHIILYVTDAYGCLTVCEATLSCADVIRMTRFEVTDPMEGNNIGLTGVELGPNPAKNFMTLSFDANAPVEVGVSFFDFTGKRVTTESVMALRGHNEHRIDIEDKIDGVYLVQVETPQGIITRNVVIMSDK